MASYKIGEMAKLLGVTVRTLQKWDSNKTLVAHRTPTNRRYYTEEQVEQILHKSGSKQKGKIIAYARVSTYGQKKDLQNQIDFIQTFLNAKGIIMDEAITDIGSGLNYKRKAWNKLLEEVEAGKVSEIYITYQDRFIRFGYDWFAGFCERHGTKIIVLNRKKTSPDQELVDDLVSIIQVFSCRLCGLRKYKKHLEADKSLVGEDTDDSN